MPIYVEIRDNNTLVYSVVFEQAFELGRQHRDEPDPYSVVDDQDRARLVVAGSDKSGVSRRQLLVSPESAGTLSIRNLSQTIAVDVCAKQPLKPNSTRTIGMPFSVLLPPNLVITFYGNDPNSKVDSLEQHTLAPGCTTRSLPSLREKGANWQLQTTPQSLVRALQTVMDVFQCAATEANLYSAAVDGVIEMLGFDSARILLHQRGDWVPVHERTLLEQDCPPVSKNVLQRVLEQKRTFWSTGKSQTAYESLAAIESVISAPILDQQGQVVGTLYANRTATTQRFDRLITQLDAQLVELLACGVSSGIARLEQEQVSHILRTRFEQFFTPQLTRQLEETPDLLEGRESDVSILFADIRHFSRISEVLGPVETFKWLNDVLGMMSDCVLNRDGVLVDYIGDELMAMWGAPQDASNHADLACQAAIEMLDRTSELNQRWETTLGEPLDLGIGINSGVVRVGNSGSKQKFKYGPVGNAVNVASRVKGTTKYLKSRLIITGDTVERLQDAFPMRRLCDVRVFNISKPIQLVELLTQPESARIFLQTTYEEALKAFEQRRFHQAAHTISSLLNKYPDDGPSIVLLSRVAHSMAEGPDDSHAVWNLPGK